jgi:hypothetical protein
MHVNCSFRILRFCGHYRCERTADTVSRVTGLGQLLGGALLVATATSLPDLFVGISAARNGWVDRRLAGRGSHQHAGPGRPRHVAPIAWANALAGGSGSRALGDDEHDAACIGGHRRFHPGQDQRDYWRGEHRALAGGGSILPWPAARPL